MHKRGKKREPVSIGSVFGQILESHGLSTRYYYERAVTIWEEAAGKEISSCSRAMRVENGTLFISVQNAVMRQEMHFMKNSLIQAVNNKLGKNVIRDLILR